MKYQMAPFGHAIEDRCTFVMAVVGRCKHPAVKKAVCEYHLDQRCHCGEQAYYACEHEDCAVLTCTTCEPSHQTHHARTVYEFS